MSSRSGGQPDSASAPNGNTIAYVYDTAGQLSSMVTTNSGGTPADYSWTRNRAGQLLSEDSEIDNDPANGTTTYTYDPLARLSDYTRAGSTTAYDWQAVPNRTSVQVDANDPVTYYFDDANREYDSSLGTITYNDEGQLTGYPGQVLDWNDLGQLTTVKDSTTQDPIAAYTYDALDRLLTVDHGSGDVVRFRYVGLSTQVAQVVDDATDDVLYSVANDLAGTRLFEWDGSTETFYGTNAHHDVTWTADSSGDVSATLRYDPWGNLTASWGSYLPAFRFQGSWFDPTVELSWVVARWYAPELGRFISEDSVIGEPSGPPSRHLYAYAEGEPIAGMDLAGHFRTPAGMSMWTKRGDQPWFYDFDTDALVLPDLTVGGACLTTLAPAFVPGVGELAFVVGIACSAYGIGRAVGGGEGPHRVSQTTTLDWTDGSHMAVRKVVIYGVMTTGTNDYGWPQFVFDWNPRPGRMFDFYFGDRIDYEACANPRLAFSGYSSDTTCGTAASWEALMYPSNGKGAGSPTWVHSRNWPTFSGRNAGIGYPEPGPAPTRLPVRARVHIARGRR
jgi:RHS repeat-associated protein